jgi:hypothetical protein
MNGEAILYITRVEKRAVRSLFWQFSVIMQLFSKIRVFTTVNLEKEISP